MLDVDEVKRHLHRLVDRVDEVRQVTYEAGVEDVSTPTDMAKMYAPTG